MTAKHVINRLSGSKPWLILLKSNHEEALLVNALIDCNYKYNEEKYYVGVFKCGLDIHTLLYKELKYIHESCEDITEWFFKEVNNF